MDRTAAENRGQAARRDRDSEAIVELSHCLKESGLLAGKTSLDPEASRCQGGAERASAVEPNGGDSSDSVSKNAPALRIDEL
jgi:hypothetical protein